MPRIESRAHALTQWGIAARVRLFVHGVMWRRDSFESSPAQGNGIREGGYCAHGNNIGMRTEVSRGRELASFGGVSNERGRHS